MEIKYIWYYSYIILSLVIVFLMYEKEMEVTLVWNLNRCTNIAIGVKKKPSKVRLYKKISPAYSLFLLRNSLISWIVSISLYSLKSVSEC